MMAEILATRHESARALEMLAQAIGGFVRGGPDGNGGNGGGARAPTTGSQVHLKIDRNQPFRTTLQIRNKRLEK